MCQQAGKGNTGRQPGWGAAEMRREIVGWRSWEMAVAATSSGNFTWSWGVGPQQQGADCGRLCSDIGDGAQVVLPGWRQPGDGQQERSSNCWDGKMAS